MERKYRNAAWDAICAAQAASPDGKAPFLWNTRFNRNRLLPFTSVYIPDDSESLYNVVITPCWSGDQDKHSRRFDLTMVMPGVLQIDEYQMGGGGRGKGKSVRIGYKETHLVIVYSDGFVDSPRLTWTKSLYETVLSFVTHWTRLHRLSQCLYPEEYQSETLRAVIRVAYHERAAHLAEIGLHQVVALHGCSIRCDGCNAASLFDPLGGQLMPVWFVAYNVAEIGRPLVISGGEPLDQARSTLLLCATVRKIAPNIPITLYTGRTWEQFYPILSKEERAMLLTVNTVVDGRFVKDLQNYQHGHPLGSLNQRTIDVALSVSEGKVVLSKAVSSPIAKILSPIAQVNDNIPPSKLLAYLKKAKAEVLKQ